MIYIKLFLDYLDAIEPLGDAERGRLFTALLQYARTGEAPQLSGNERFLFPMMRAQIDRDSDALDEKEEKKRNARKEAGRLGGLAKASKAGKSKQTIANVAKEEEKDEDEDKDTIPPKPPKGGGDVFADYAGANGELLAALTDFEAMRKKIKRPLTDRAKRMLCKRLDELAAEPVAKVGMLNEAVLHCWQTVYLPKTGGLPVAAYRGKVPCGSAGQGPLGEFEQAALDRMLERAKEGDAT